MLYVFWRVFSVLNWYCQKVKKEVVLKVYSFIWGMHNIHRRVNCICRKLSELAEDFLGMIIIKKCSLLSFKKFCHLRKNFCELLIYKLLRESSFNLFCPFISLACVFAFESLKIATTWVIKWLKLYVILYVVFPLGIFCRALHLAQFSAAQNAPCLSFWWYKMQPAHF